MAPVINWLFYHSIYTERYLDLPNEQPASYDASSVLNKIDNFSNKRYMINHGNADDNVNYQNSMMLIKALEYDAIPFRQQAFPDQAHSITLTRSYVYDSMERFWVEECFELGNTRS